MSIRYRGSESPLKDNKCVDYKLPRRSNRGSSLSDEHLFAGYGLKRNSPISTHCVLRWYLRLPYHPSRTGSSDHKISKDCVYLTFSAFAHCPLSQDPLNDIVSCPLAGAAVFFPSLSRGSHHFDVIVAPILLLITYPPVHSPSPVGLRESGSNESVF